MAEQLSIPGGILSMTAEAADRLIAGGDGDAALLYLSLLSRGGDLAGSRKKLKWTETRLHTAYEKLLSLRLASPQQVQDAVVPKPESDEPPDYTTEDITQALEHVTPFSGLVNEVQRRLGKVLSATDLKILYTVYDFLALPAEVILLLVTWCVNQTEEKYGQGRRPTLPQIRSEAFRWKRCGADTPEAAEEHLKQMTNLRRQGTRLLSLVGILGRTPVEGERKYVEAWVQMGFEDEAIRLAYEKTVLKKQAMSWPYMNSILRSWHQKGLHTLEQIQREDSTYRRAGPSGVTAQPAPAAVGEADRRVREDMERMRRFLEKKKLEEGGD